MRTMPLTDELERLQVAHHNLDRELKSITRHAYLTPHEQQRARVIKKEKLRTKDKMRLLMTRAQPK